MSLPTQGNFDCAAIQVILAKADSIFSDDIRKQEYVADVDAAKAILENQTAKFQILQDPEKDREVKTYWVDDCDNEEPGDCTDECEINGDEAGASCVNYTLDECFQKEFKVTRKQFRSLDLTLEEVMATQLLKKMKLMDEFWAKKAIQFLDLNSGINAFEAEMNVVGNLTYVPAASWNEDLFGYIATLMKVNKLSSNAKMLSGSNLYRLFWKLKAEASNPTGQGAIAKLAGFENPYFDLFQLDTVVGDKATFIFNPNSVAMVTKTYNDATSRVHQNPFQIVQTIDSYNLPGVKYDLTYMPSCSGNDWTDAWRIQTKGGIFLNPIGCDSGRTGIVQLRCGTGS